ncbi:uncharacterized protein [Penaeus vannamei]|uniref:uncharacterized protein n=1 Tax=Penaeus vannamei TaxID=6689 RepID=UPI00387FA96B
MVTSSLGRLTALSTFRRTEKLSFRSKKLQKDIRFLRLCKDYHVIPNFVNFRVHNPMFEHTQIYRSWCFHLLNRELTRQMNKETIVSKKLDNDFALLKSTLSPFDFIFVSRFINGNVENKLRKVDSVHSKKLLHLGIDIKKKVDKNKVIFNFSNIILTEEQKDVLSYGLDYCIPQTKLAFHKFYLYFEKLCSTIKNCDIYNNFNNVANNITTIANNTFRKFSHQRKQTRDSDAFLSPLQTLKNDNSIVITKPDKGRGVVIVNKCDYKQKLMDILNDQTKFKRISTEISTHLLYLEDKLNRLLRTIKSSISLNTYNSLLSSGSRPGVLYGLPKVHKPNIPLRPIISSIGTFNYNAAKFLVPVISPLTTNHYTIDNSTAFAKEITSLNYQNPVTMASFDVESLFTNVPLHETTELIVSNLDISHLDKFGLDKVHFRKLLEITAHHSVFCFDDCFVPLMAEEGVVAMSPGYSVLMLRQTLSKTGACFSKILLIRGGTRNSIGPIFEVEGGQV